MQSGKMRHHFVKKCTAAITYLVVGEKSLQCIANGLSRDSAERERDCVTELYEAAGWYCATKDTQPAAIFHMLDGN